MRYGEWERTPHILMRSFKEPEELGKVGICGKKEKVFVEDGEKGKKGRTLTRRKK